MKQPDDFDADTARELLGQHAHDDPGEEIEIVNDMPRPDRQPCTRAELEEIVRSATAHPSERRAAQDALARGDFLP